MTYDSTEDITDTTPDPELDNDVELDDADERKAAARRRIDDIMEQKRLKALLDDSDDWDI
ncbi:PA3496 family putative envelope integrity protein [Thalassotalea fusca]